MFYQLKLNQPPNPWLILAAGLLMSLILELNLIYADASTPNSNAIKDLYSMQIDALLTQKEYETLTKYNELRLKQLEQENQRLFWSNVTCVVALGYSLGNSR